MSTIPIGTSSSQPPIAAHAAAAAPGPSAGRRSRFRPGRLLALARGRCARCRRIGAGDELDRVPAHPLDHRRRLRRGSHRQRRPANGLRPAHPVSSSMRTTGSSRGRSWRRSTRFPTATRSTSRGLNSMSAEAELARQRADLDRVRKEVPIQIEIARRTFAAAAGRPGQGRGIAEADPRRSRERHRRGPRRS